MKAITEPAEATLSRAWLRQQGLTVKPLLGAAVLCGVFNALAIVAQMGCMAWLVQAVLVDGQGLQELTWPVLGLFVAIVLRALAQAVQERCGQVASHRVRQRVRQQLLQSWERLGPVRLASHSSATLTQHWVEQVEALDGYYARYLPQQWLALLAPLPMLLVAFWLDWLAAVFLLLAAPLIPLFMALVGMSAERISQQHVLLAGRLSGHFLDRVRSLTSLQLFGQTRQAVSSVQQAAEDYRHVSMRTLKVAFLSSAVLEFFASVAIAVVAMYIGFGLLGYIQYGPAPELTLFSGLFILLLAPEFFQPLRSLAQHYHDRAAALAAAGVIAALQQQADAVPEPLQPSQMASVVDGIRVRGLSLAYSGRGQILDGIDLDVPRGQILALTGPSGAGKSSLLHCLAGFVEPDSGSVQVFGRTPGAVPKAWMGQRAFLVQGSWADNLRLTAPDASPDSMRHALEAVGLGALLALRSEGLDTPLGETGLGLSGGQAQRLALARVWLADSELILLDEPTASLDAESEAEVVEALGALARQQRTLVIATHHPALMALADRRVALHQGRLVDV